MSPEDFIRALKIRVHDGSLRAVREMLERPAGRKPEQSVVGLSEWYHSLSDADREQLMEAVEHAVHASIFNFLCVLDEVSTIEHTEKKGELELHYVRDSVRTLLNDREKEFLHDIYHGEVYDEVFGKKG